MQCSWDMGVVAGHGIVLTASRLGHGRGAGQSVLSSGCVSGVKSAHMVAGLVGRRKTSQKKISQQVEGWHACLPCIWGSSRNETRANLAWACGRRKKKGRGYWACALLAKIWALDFGQKWALGLESNKNAKSEIKIK